jgi:hypothetical protein
MLQTKNFILFTVYLATHTILIQCWMTIMHNGFQRCERQWSNVKFTAIDQNFLAWGKPFHDNRYLGWNSNPAVPESSRKISACYKRRENAYRSFSIHSTYISRMRGRKRHPVSYPKHITFENFGVPSIINFLYILSADNLLHETTASCSVTLKSSLMLAIRAYGYFYRYRTPWSLVRKRTIPTERPPLVGEF